jgi:hypothetical protein
MTPMKILTLDLAADDETTRQIEEAAYYSWLNRGRYAQAGNELNDWIDGEKEVRNKNTSEKGEK